MNQQTDFFIKNILNPDCQWAVSPHKQFKSVMELLTNADEAAISKHINSISYSDFLNTPYWKAVAQQVRWKHGFLCRECQRKGQTLHVHHKSYEHHGKEHKHLEDLECLCGQCHREHHGLETVVYDMVFPLDEMGEKEREVFRNAWTTMRLIYD